MCAVRGLLKRHFVTQSIVLTIPTFPAAFDKTDLLYLRYVFGMRRNHTDSPFLPSCQASSCALTHRCTFTAGTRRRSRGIQR